MKIILAISGGVDSMVMLDIFGNYLAGEAGKWHGDLAVYGCAKPKVVVATFNHGTRPSAKDDALFVQQTCGRRYFHVPCFTGEDNLGVGVSEEIAREHRYDFLYALAEKMQGPNELITIREDADESEPARSKDEETFIFTAHHLDDLVETVAINLIRGTGWRGLAVLDTPGIARPFLDIRFLPERLREYAPFDKKEILRYAAAHGITFRQDPTNNEEDYLRNRLRKKLGDFRQKKEIYKLWQKQKKIKREIDALVEELLPERGESWQRSWFINLDEKVALELLRAGTLRAKISATRPQLLNFLNAIKTYKPGKSFNLPNDKLIKFTKNEFYLD